MTTTNHAIRSSFMSLFPVVLLAFASPAWTAPYEVRAGFPRVPGADELESGQIDQAIAKLEAQLGVQQHERQGSVLTTLCAAYIVKGNLESAMGTCDAAVESRQRTAYNNRGVLRALQGDFAGADADFAMSARPAFSRMEAIITDARRQTAKRNAQESSERLAAEQKRGDAVAKGNP